MSRGAENDWNAVDASYRSFIHWLFEFLFASLHLDSTFAKRNQSLNTMTVFLEIFGSKCIDEQSQEKTLFDFNCMFKQERLFTLIECLWDTYEVNKDMAIRLLERLDSQLFATNVSYNVVSKKIRPDFEKKLDFNICFKGIMAKDYFQVSIEFLSSRRPIDSITSVYLMIFIQKKFNLRDVCEKGRSEKIHFQIFQFN